MGSSCDWICSNEECDGKVDMVSGGEDRGFSSFTQTRICKACKLVKDYVVGVVSNSTHQVFTEEERAQREDPEPACRECGEATVAWKLECPRCGLPMKHDPNGGVIDWD